MIDTQVREVTTARPATSSAMARSEPSHIHIARPSRLKPSTSRPVEPDPIAVQLALDEAA